MNLRWYDRILVALSGLILIALGVFIVLAASGVIALPEALALDTWLGDGWQWMPIVFLAGVVLVIWGIWLLIRPFRRGREAGGRYYVLKDEADGNVKISVHAIDHLVRKRLDLYSQITSARVKIGGREDAMHITLHLAVDAEVQIPALIEELREDIRNSLQHSAGVTVQTVQVYIDATKDEKNEDIKRLQEKNPPAESEAPPTEDLEDTASFYTAPIVVTDDALPKEIKEIAPQEPTVAELKEEIDFGPDEPLPVTLSGDAFPFPEKEAGVPLEIYTQDVPFEEETKEDEDVH